MNGIVSNVLQNLLASFLWTVIVSAVTVLGTKAWRSWQRKKRLEALRQVADADAVALCFRIGGRGNPLPDVEEYLCREQPNIKKLLFYDAPANVDLADPETALSIIDDLSEAANELGIHKLSEFHFFPSGMVAYPFALGAMIGNWCPVTVYHLHDGKYIPLYTIKKESIRKARISRSLGKMEVHDLIHAPSQIPATTVSPTQAIVNQSTAANIPPVEQAQQKREAHNIPQAQSPRPGTTAPPPQAVVKQPASESAPPVVQVQQNTNNQP